MRILIEEYQYTTSDDLRQKDLKTILRELGGFEDLDGKVSIHYVGYYYSAQLRDCVFILPKVLINENGFVFEDKENNNKGYKPEEIIDFENIPGLADKQRKFIYEFAVWIFRTIDVYRTKNQKSSIIYHKQIAQVGKGRRRVSNTFLDILLSLIQFNHDNQNFFFFTLKNQHAGLNKINWTRTISKSQAFVQDECPVYLKPVNKKRKINFDEELLVIFFSILNYINDKYGFTAQVNVNFPLIPKLQFENYICGMGKVRLHQIKFKYYSDKAIQLWELCYAFFDKAYQINISAEIQEYLLAKDFNIVFESIIDELVGDELPAKYRPMKEQKDGKLVDHMYNWYNVVTRDKEEQQKIMYIGDSKYYKRKNCISEESWYKQFTYARNVIQWNLDLFLNGKNEKEDILLRDETTEGYNITPNFFISATLDDDLSYKTDIYPTAREKKFHFSRQFDNRLFDRDSLLVCHYDVNFLYVISLYARGNKGQQQAWKTKVRDLFRKEIQRMLDEKYNFYVLTPKNGVNATTYIVEHFQQLLGKVFTPYENDGTQRYYSLALSTHAEYKDENEAIVSQLKTSFHIRECNIGDNPRVLLANILDEPVGEIPTTPDFHTLYYLEKYKDKSVVIGCYHDSKHLAWIMGDNDRGTQLYNLRLGKNVHGGQVKSQLDRMMVSFAILYEYGHEHENVYRVFRVHHHATMTAKRLTQSRYPSVPSAEKYLCYVFDEEISLGHLNLSDLLSKERIGNRDYNDGAPIFKTGEEMMEYRIK
jgi:hypothetical protein